MTLEKQQRIREQIQRGEAKQFCLELAPNSIIHATDFPSMVQKIVDLFGIITRQIETVAEQQKTIEALERKVASLDDTVIIEKPGTDIDIAKRRSGPGNCSAEACQ